MPSQSQPAAAKVHQLFAGIARRYDRLNDVMSFGLHRYWKRRLVTLAGEARDVLDLCCGTGDIALRLTRRGGFTGHVVGVDFTEQMLRVAQARSIHDSITPILQHSPSWLRADALRLPFPDNSFDVVSVGYGLRNLADLEAGLREVYRVLRPGGQLVSLDFGKPANALWRRLYFGHLRFWVPVLGWLLAGNRAAYAYILPSLASYPGQRGVRTAMERCGFATCWVEDLLGGAMALNGGRKPDGEAPAMQVSPCEIPSDEHAGTQTIH